MQKCGACEVRAGVVKCRRNAGKALRNGVAEEKGACAKSKVCTPLYF